MRVIRTSRGRGRVAANEDDLFLANIEAWPGASGTKTPPLIFCHGVNDYTDTQAYATIPLMNELANYFTVCYADLGGDQWGNGTHQSRIEAARLYLANTFGSTGPVTLVGISMGTIGALNYLKTYPANVRCIAGIIPALDILDLRNNRGLSASIDAAYNGAYSEVSFGLSNNPVTFAPIIASDPVRFTPIHLFASPADAVAVPSTVAAFRAGRPQTFYRDCGNAGHDQPTIAAAHPYVVNFVRTLYPQPN